MGIREMLKASLGRAPTPEEVKEAKEKRDASKRKFEKRAEAVVKPQDWSCAACGARCFGSKDSCFKCGAGKDGSTENSKKHRRRDGIYQGDKEEGDFQDKTLTCRVCATEFVFSAGEQEYFYRKHAFIGVDRARCTECAKSKKRKVEAKPTCGGRLICFDWKKGSCARGDGCAFAHGEADGVLGEGPGSSSTPRLTGDVAKPLKCFHCNGDHRVAECPKVKEVLQGREKKAMAAPMSPPKQKKKKKRNRNGTLPTANQPDGVPSAS